MIFLKIKGVLDENTITVSPFCGESDICPRDKDASRLIHV